MALYAFDGTLNRRDSKAAIEAVQSPKWGQDAAHRRDTTETNVHRFREFFGTARTEYLQGVGTRFHLIGKALGGIFGVGGRYRLRRMYLALCARYHGGDHDIDVVGFSRGAALAIHFTHVIERYGVPDPLGPRHRGFRHYAGLGWTFRFPKLAPPAAPITVRFLGLWDTVATFGVPIRPFRNRSKRWWITTIPGNVLRSFHAMALDEVRTTFALVRPTPARTDQHYEVWFRGAHSNIGGSYPDRGLSDIALAWMMEMYLWTLDFEKQSIASVGDDFVDALRMIGPERLPTPKHWAGTSLETVEPDADGELGLPAAVRRSAWREIPESALFHHSVQRRTKNLISDHYRANRRLLRQIPGDARPVYDPPFFYSETPQQAGERVAAEAFGNIPVRAAAWFRVRDAYPVRSDDWLAPAPQLNSRREDLTVNCSRNTFMRVATAWLQAGKPAAAALDLRDPLTDFDGNVIDTRDAAAWIVEVLRLLELYVPELRDYQPYPPRPPTSAGTAAPPPGDQQ
jgi:hypothetical protein